MKKRMLPILLSLAILAGCTSNGSVEEEPIKLTIWHYYGGTAEQTFDYLVQRFNQTEGAEYNIVVEAQGYDGVGQLADDVALAATGAAGTASMPSIFASYADSVIPLIAQDKIANLDDTFTAQDLEGYYAPFVEEGRLGTNGELMILPIAKSTEVLHLNATAFDAFAQETGYTTDDLATWEGLAEVAAAYYSWTDEMTDTPNDGAAFFGTDGMANFMIVGTKQLGHDIFTVENGTVSHHFSQEVAQRFWDTFYIPYLQGFFSAEAGYRSDDVASGEIIAYVGSTASSYYFPPQAKNLAGDYGDIQCITLPYPVFEGGDAVAVQQGAGMAVSKSTPEEEAAAARFLKWFTQESNNLGFAVSTGYMPVVNASLDVELILDEMARDSSVDTSLPIVQATYTTYHQLERYDLYTSIPFQGSADARTVLETSLLNRIQLDLAKYEAWLLSGATLEGTLTKFVGEENFLTWYTEITRALDQAIQP